MGNDTDSCAITGEPLETHSRMPQSKARSVFIGIPSFWHIDPHFHQAMLKAMAEFRDQEQNENTLHAQVQHSFGDSPNVGRSRNGLTRSFLESDCTDLLFIDSDLIFSKAHIDRIMAHEEDVVGGIYFKKQEGRPAACINPKREPELKENGLIEVGYMGTGFLRIRRDVFERMIEKFGDELWYTTDTPPKVKEYNFWHLGVYQYPDGSRRWLSEDWWFCQRCADLGIKVWADRAITLKHSGHAIYPLSYQAEKIFSQGGEPAAIDNSVAAAPHTAVTESI